MRKKNTHFNCILARSVKIDVHVTHDSAELFVVGIRKQNFVIVVCSMGNQLSCGAWKGISLNE